MTTATADQRRQLLTQLFPETMPRLWCPPLTHYTPDGAIDRSRMAAHVGHISIRVKGYLIPGTAGDGWELSGPETREVLEFAVESAQALHLHVLVGVLKADAAAARAGVLDTVEWLRDLTGAGAAGEAMSKSGVCGFAVCPPTGRDVPQETIRAGLTSVLELGLPTALYQLPQVTQNEMSPETVASLAERFANLFLFKDSSGADRVALRGHCYGGVFLVRGMEGDYARWLRDNGGPYDGLLLSTANCFPRELSALVESSAAGKRAEAEAISEQVSSLMAAVFPLVESLPHGNRFTNANKAIDHFMAHGPRAANVPPPRLHGGSGLPVEVIQRVGEELERHDLMPSGGYL
jgi:dihydrodipicolinate synthase/N-acetylneuraminate lyase